MQITSASGKLQKLKAEQDESTPLPAIWGRICDRCYQSNHTKPTCISANPGYVRAATTASSEKNTPRWKQKYHCKEKWQDPETTQKAEWIRSFVDTREKLKSVSFSVMRNRLCLKNLPKYSDCLKLDKDLLVLRTACITKWSNEMGSKDGNWQLLLITEQFHHAKLAPLFAGEKNLCWRPFDVQHQASLNQSGAPSFP